MNNLERICTAGLCAIGFSAVAAVPTDYDQYLLELINRGRANPVAEAARYGISDLNEGVPEENTISTDPKPPLAFHPALVDAARNHSLWMLENDTFSHTGNGGSSSSERMSSAGYPLSPAWGTGENIAWSGATGSYDPVARVEQLHRNLFVDNNYPGRGHRVNQMNPSMKEAGCGVEFGIFTRSGADWNAGMITEDFAYSGGSSNGYAFITGIAWDETVSADDFYTPGEGLGNVLISATSRDSLVTYLSRTWSSGGYSLAVPPGTYDISATGGELEGAAVTNGVVIGSQNIKIDFMPVMLYPDAKIAVYASKEIFAGDYPPSRTAGTDLGSSGLNRPAARRTFTVRNLGSQPLTISTPTLPDGFILVEGPDSSIPIGGFDSFTVRLDTSSAGTQEGMIGFTTNDPDEPFFTFAISGRVNAGTGLALIQPISDIPATTNFTSTVIDLHHHFDETGIDGTVVEIPSDLGTFYIEMFDIVTPVTVQNFLTYLEDGHYIDTFIHRSIPGFILQSGGFRAVGRSTYYEPQTGPSIINEFDNWFSADLGNRSSDTPINIRGSLSMAKQGGDPDSATSQFFFNLNDNSGKPENNPNGLDFQNSGFTVFAQVIYDGMEIIDAMENVPVYTNNPAPLNNLPLHNFSDTNKTIFLTLGSPAVAPELTLSIISNSAPSLIDASISTNGYLSLNRLSGTGIASITVQATDLTGSTIEETFRISIAAPEDTDGDGFSNYEEFIADTDPDMETDFFSIDSISDGTLRFMSSSDRLYTMLYTTNLPAGSWNPVSGYSGIPGSGSNAVFNTTTDDPSGYYRIEVSIP